MESATIIEKEITLKTSKFKLGYFHLSTCEMGRLVPVGLQEVLPGDIFSMRTSILARMTPLLAPIMHPIQIRIHHFFVPNRLLWRFWGEFIASSPKTKDMTIPTTNFLDTYEEGTLADYFNLPIGNKDAIGSGEDILAFPFLAYLMIWKEFFADEQLQSDKIAEIEELLEQVYESKGGRVPALGGKTLAELKAFAVAWSKDYFTSARNEPQIGDDVAIPVQAGATANSGISIRNARIDSNGFSFPLKVSAVLDPNAGDSDSRNGVYGTRLEGASNVFSARSYAYSIPRDTSKTEAENIAAFQELVKQQPTGHITADKILNNKGQDVLAGQSISLQDLRNALALGRINEHRNMYGTRFVEYLNYLGVKTSDYRLQRPILLGSGRQLIQISEVLQTAEATGGVVGSMKGHGLGVTSSNRFIRGFEEHGFILSFVSIVPKTIYTNGIPKMWSRKIPYDWWQKELQNLGMQPIKNKEVYFGKDIDHNEEVFGYQNIWDEYRTNQSRISGEFRSLFRDWHLSREFATPPALNSDFIACNPTKRVFAEQTGNPFLLMIRNFAVARRLVSKRANPKTF